MDHSLLLLLPDERYNELSSKFEHGLDFTSNSSTFNDFANLHIHEYVGDDLDGLNLLSDLHLDFT